MKPKKLSRKAASARGKTAGAARATLQKELRAAMGELDEKDLLFLLRQAQVLIHNARVERLQAAAGSDEEPRPAVAERAGPEAAWIETAEGGKRIFLTLGRTRKVLAPEEMKRLVRICYAAETKSEALRQLFTVLARERKDILTDAMIGSPDSPLIERLFLAVRETYRLTDR